MSNKIFFVESFITFVLWNIKLISETINYYLKKWLAGNPAPDFTLKSVDGSDFSLTDLKGNGLF